MNMRKPLVLLASSLLALGCLTACSSDNSGSTEKFCAKAATLKDIDDEDFAKQADALQELAKLAPEKQLREDISYMADAWKEMTKLDFDDPDSFQKFAEKWDTDRIEAIGDSMEGKMGNLCPDVDFSN